MTSACLMLLWIAVLATGCGDDGPNGSPPEDCCSCVEQNTCGGDGFDFASCVNDGYWGEIDQGVSQECVTSSCSSECAEADFQ